MTTQPNTNSAAQERAERFAAVARWAGHVTPDAVRIEPQSDGAVQVIVTGEWGWVQVIVSPSVGSRTRWWAQGTHGNFGRDLRRLNPAAAVSLVQDMRPKATTAEPALAAELEQLGEAQGTCADCGEGVAPAAAVDVEGFGARAWVHVQPIQRPEHGPGPFVRGCGSPVPFQASETVTSTDGPVRGIIGTSQVQPEDRPDEAPRILRQDAVTVVSNDPAMAAEVDRRWTDDPALTVGERMRRMDDLCAAVLRERGYRVAVTVAEVQAAALILGPAATAAVVGPAGLSGATAGALSALVGYAALPVPF